MRGQVLLTTNGEPVPGVTVVAAGRSTVTDSEGRYEISDVPDGQWAVYLEAVPEGMYLEVYDDLLIGSLFGPPSAYALADDLVTVDGADVAGIDFQIGFGGSG